MMSSLFLHTTFTKTYAFIGIPHCLCPCFGNCMLVSTGRRWHWRRAWWCQTMQTVMKFILWWYKKENYERLLNVSVFACMHLQLPGEYAAQICSADDTKTTLSAQLPSQTYNEHSQYIIWCWLTITTHLSFKHAFSALMFSLSCKLFYNLDIFCNNIPKHNLKSSMPWKEHLINYALDLFQTLPFFIMTGNNADVSCWRV